MEEASEQASSSTGVDGKEIIYSYEPLKSPNDIRVLELAGGGPDAPLEARLIHNPNVPAIQGIDVLEWSREYEALSYAWGAPFSGGRYPRIILNEIYYLPIQPSLDAALRHLRYPNFSRALWVDAVCINQANPEEKSAQVERMLDIYARAKVVNIWVGPAGGDTPKGMEILRYLAESTLEEPAPWIQSPEAPFLAGLSELLQRDWFSRMWVVQEVAVSQKAVMICGKDSFQWTNDPIPLRSFIRRIKYVTISPQWEQAGLTMISPGRFVQVLNLQLQHIERQRKEVFSLPPDILDVAFEMRHRKATDRRDKLFAILRVADQRNGSKLHPDYSVDIETVFQRLLSSVEI